MQPGRAHPQLVILPVVQASFQLVDEFNQSERVKAGLVLLVANNKIRTAPLGRVPNNRIKPLFFRGIHGKQ